MTEIYAICSRTTGKIYVGKTVYMCKRLNSHKSGTRSYISRAIHKHGWDDFVLVILAKVPDKAASQLEQEWIKRLGTIVPDGYNLTEGGEGTVGLICSETTKEKIAATKRGKPLSQEHRDKISKTTKGRPHSAEHTRKIIDTRTKNFRKRKGVA